MKFIGEDNLLGDLARDMALPDPGLNESINSRAALLEESL
jgi:hypothetical protein